MQARIAPIRPISSTTWIASGITEASGRYFSRLKMAACPSAIASGSPKCAALSRLISGCILTILMEFLCSHTEIGSSTSLLSSVNSPIARAKSPHRA